MAVIPDFVPQEHTELLRHWVRAVCAKEKTSGDKLLRALGAWLAKEKDKHPQLQLMTKPTLTRLRSAAHDHAGERSGNQLRALWLFLGAHDIYRRHFPESELNPERRPPSPAEPEKLLAFALENLFPATLRAEDEFHELRRKLLPGTYVMYTPDMRLAEMETLKRSGKRVAQRVRLSLVEISKDDSGLFITETEQFPRTASEAEYHEVHTGPLVSCGLFMLAVMKRRNAQLFKCLVIERMEDVRTDIAVSFEGKLLEPGEIACWPTVKFFCQRANGGEETGYRSYGAIPRQIAKYLRTPTFDPKLYPFAT